MPFLRPPQLNWRRALAEIALMFVGTTLTPPSGGSAGVCVPTPGPSVRRGLA